MPPPANHFDQGRRFRTSGLSLETFRTTATQLWDMSSKDTERANRKIMTRFALDATTCDILGELMLKFRQQEEQIDSMSRQLKRDDLPASFYNTRRLLLSDATKTLMLLSDLREKEGRYRVETPETKVEKQEEYDRQVDIHQRATEAHRISGYFYDTRHGLLQPGNDLLGFDLAVRDIVRMRMLPKSPYEDHMIAKMFDALLDKEKGIDPESLSKEEHETDLERWTPEVFAGPGISKYEAYDKVAQAIFLERIQEYNRVWEEAEKHVDGLMAAKGIKPTVRHPFVGLPPVVRLAAKGDPDAINELQTIINNTRLAATQSGASAETSVPPVPPRPVYSPGEGPGVRAGSNETLTPIDYERDFGKPCAILIALLLAFTSAWTCFTLIVGPTAIAHVMPCEPTDVEPWQGSMVLHCPLQTCNTEYQLLKHITSPTACNHIFSSTCRGQMSTSDPCHEPPFFLAFSSDPHLTG